ncbi:MAG: glycosyl transferase [Agathobacter sp.]|nr:glycosyl transferase [Agathobacter sp.]
MKALLEKITHIIPDKLYTAIRWRMRMGYWIDFKNPVSFNEKIQWLKLNDHKDIYPQLVDKYRVRSYIKDTIGEEYLIPLLGAYDSYDEIDFDALPDQFVLKCNHDSGGLVICRDKQALDHEKAKEKITASLKRNYYWHTREWAYKKVQPKIIAEKYVTDGAVSAEGNTDLVDYKFFCFGGKPKFLNISKGLENHKTALMTFVDLKGEKMPFDRSDYKKMEGKIDLPENFDEMCSLAEKIAQNLDIPFIRVDLYSIEGKTFFSELTLYPCAGMIPIEPKEWDIKMGSWIDLSKVKGK